MWERREEAFVMQRELRQAVVYPTSVSISPEHSLCVHPHREMQFVALTHTRARAHTLRLSNKSSTFANWRNFQSFPPFPSVCVHIVWSRKCLASSELAPGDADLAAAGSPTSFTAPATASA